MPQANDGTKWRMLWDLVEPGSELWTAALRDSGTISIICRNTYGSARLDGGRPCAFIARDDDGLFLLPLILRPIEIGSQIRSFSMRSARTAIPRRFSA